MKKVILASGIFVVFLLEVAFGVYVALERRFESALIAKNQMAEFYEVPGDDVTLIDTEDQMAAIEFAEHSAVNFRISDNKKPARSVAGNRRKRKTNLLTANKTARLPYGMEPVKISYAVGKPFEFKTKSEFTAAQPVDREPADLRIESKKVLPTAENKSFIAKTLPILKKPFDWIKAIASKLK